jgi:hypothetical protein
MRKNYVLIDFENVQPESLAALQHDHFEIKIFLGATQTKISFEIAQAMQTMGPRAEYIKMGGTGSNALDFHIAYYIGHLSAKDPTAYFHIISKDTGFDPLIAHLNAKNISVIREGSIEDIPLVKSPLPPILPRMPQPVTSISAPTPIYKPEPHLLTIVGTLRPTKATKPLTVKSLTSHIKATLPNTISETEITSLIADMAKRHLITITDNKITYHL